jgi:hypothetical protein
MEPETNVLGYQTNIARLMVRRHLRSWLDAGVPEDELIALFVLALRISPDISMKDIAAYVDRRLREATVAQYLKERG